MPAKPFWKDIVGDSDIINDKRCQETLSALLANEFRGQLERKKVGDDYVYITRINDADRLLFATVQVAYQNEQGEMRQSPPFIVPLEIVENHDYQKAKFLKAEVFNAYVDKNLESITEKILAKLKASNESNMSMTNPLVKLKFTNVCYHDKLIPLDDIQEKAVKMKFPMVVSGAAGSGKTTVLEAILEDYALSEEHRGKSGLCVAKSPKLLATLKARYERMLQRNYPNGLPQDQVRMDFKTPEQLVLEQEEFKNRQLVGMDDFKSWAKEYLDKQTQIEKSKSKGKGKSKNKGKNKNKGKGKDKSNINAEFFKELAGDLQKVYEECRILSAYEKERYLELGKAQTKFTKEKRADIYKLYEAYLAYLNSNNKLNIDIQMPRLTTQYDLVMIDEAQDLSYLQLKRLTSAAKDSQFCCFMDSHQSLFDSQSKRPFLLQELEVEGVNLAYYQLPVIYRCPLIIANFAEKIIQLKNVVTRGIADKLEQYKIKVSEGEGKAEGEVVWQADYSQEAINAFKRHRKVTEVAIITLPEFKEEAEKLFGTVLVFTPEEIKGLEYPAVACYKLFEESGFKEANQILKTIPVEQYQSYIHRPKREGEDDNKSFAPLFNRLFTACTRASESLHIFQKKHHHIGCFTQYLEGNAKPVNEKATDIAPSVAVEAASVEETREELKEHVMKLLANGSEDQARKFFLSHKLGSSADFKKLASGDTVSNQEKTTSSNQINEVQWLKELYNNFTPSSLVKLFSHKSWVKLLFDTPFQLKEFTTITTLFSAIAYDKKRLEIFCEAIRGNNDFFIQLRDHVSVVAKELCSIISDREYGYMSALYWLSFEEEGQVILKGLLENSPKLAEQISTEALCGLNKHSSFSNKSAFYWLSSYGENGLAILKELLGKNANFEEQVVAEALCSPASDFRFSEILYTAYLPNGREVLKAMRKKGDPFLSKNVSLEKFNSMYQDKGFQNDKGKPFEVLPSENVSAFYWLSSSSQGRAILKELLEKNTRLAEYISAEVLCRLIKGYVCNDMSAFFLLSTSLEGQVILKELLEKNAKLAEQIPAEILYQLANTTPYGDTSALYWLSILPEGREVLKVLIEKNTELAKQITAEVLCCKVGGTDQRKMSVLYCLSGTPEGQEILKMLLDVNPDLAKQIPVEDMAVLLKRLVFVNISNLLNVLVECNPDLEKKVEELFKSRKDGDKLFKNWRHQYENYLKVKAHDQDASSVLVNHSLFGHSLSNHSESSNETVQQASLRS